MGNEPDVTFIPPDDEWLTVVLLTEDEDRFEKAMKKVKPFIGSRVAKLSAANKSEQLKRWVAVLLVMNVTTKKQIGKAVGSLGDIREA